MLKEWEKSEKPSEEEIKARLEAVKEKLARQQLLIKEKKVPVLVVLEGWGTAGKGYAIGQIIQNIDPRFFKVATMSAPTAEELRYPFLYRYFKQIPEARENRFCTGILPKFRKPDSLYFWIRHGWMRLRRSVCTEPFPRMYMPTGLKVSAGLNGSLQTMAIWS